MNFKHALSRIVFKAQNQNKNKTYVIKELALSNLKSKGTLNMLDSIPNGADPFLHAPGAYDVAWKAQHDSITYKVDLGSTNVLVPYGTGTAKDDYTAITNASNGLMVLPQETVLGAFTGSTPEYGTVAEIDASKLGASYLYATVAEVDYLTNDTVNRRQVVFRLHDPANKALGIVFEAGRQYTFLLTLGLDGEEIVFSIPTVKAFDESAVVDAPPLPWKCGKPIKGYTTANYSNTPIKDLCWTMTNIAEGTPAFSTFDGGAQSGRGWYYYPSEAESACQQLGPDWYVPTTSQWQDLANEYSGLTAGVGTTGLTAALQAVWNSGDALAGYYDGGWINWGIAVAWVSRGTWDYASTITTSPGVMDVNSWGISQVASARCVRTI
ncbi:hypothetical protein AGMMS49525_17420 [Bacteroidia bacterium]|nr:hypothetical protein AGMMS49525_17420 [Bacteroidia bacterium]